MPRPFVPFGANDELTAAALNAKLAPLFAELNSLIPANFVEGVQIPLSMVKGALSDTGGEINGPVNFKGLVNGVDLDELIAKIEVYERFSEQIEIARHTVKWFYADASGPITVYVDGEESSSSGGAFIPAPEGFSGDYAQVLPSSGGQSGDATKYNGSVFALHDNWIERTQGGVLLTPETLNQSTTTTLPLRIYVNVDVIWRRTGLSLEVGT